MIETRSDMKVALVRSQGDDVGVAEAAWVSTGVQATDKTAEQVNGLINFLMRDRHGTPFEHNSMTFRIEAPIAVFREFHRHRVGWSYNEESGRYTKLEPVFYVPSRQRPLIQVGKPGAYTFQMGPAWMYQTTPDSMILAYTTAYRQYEVMLNDGVAREVARMVLPVGIYSSMYATCNARSLMHFLSLRTKSEDAAVPSFPQYEIELVANCLEIVFKNLFPEVHRAWVKNGRVAP